MLYVRGKDIGAIRHLGKSIAAVYHFGKLVWANIVSGVWARSKPWSRRSPW